MLVSEVFVYEMIVFLEYLCVDGVWMYGINGCVLSHVAFL